MPDQLSPEFQTAVDAVSDFFRDLYPDLPAGDRRKLAFSVLVGGFKVLHEPPALEEAFSTAGLTVPPDLEASIGRMLQEFGKRMQGKR